MQEHVKDAEDWLNRENYLCRDGRSKRLAWLISSFPALEYEVFPGGWIVKRLYEEARYSFVYGQFLGTIGLGYAFLERLLGALFYATGRDDLERASGSKLLDEALSIGWLSAEEYSRLDHARKIRNAFLHFRYPGHRDTIEHRSVAERELPDTILENEARHVMAIALRLLAKNSV